MIGLLGKKKRKKNDLKVALQVAGDTLCLAVCEADGTVFTETFQWADTAEQELKAFIEQKKLQGASASLLLGLSDYQMLLVDAPPVEPAELAGALKWKVKDLLAQPLDDSLVEGFLLPEDAFRGSRKMAYAAGAVKAPAQKLASVCQSLGLDIDSVSVAELSTLALVDPVDEHPAILIVVGSSSGFMSAVVGQALYLVRKFDISHSMLASDGGAQQQALERLVLDIQRSRDYFESQMGKGAVNRVLTFPLSYGSLDIESELKDRLGLPVEMLATANSEQPCSEQSCSEKYCAEQYMVEALVSGSDVVQ